VKLFQVSVIIRQLSFRSAFPVHERLTPVRLWFDGDNCRYWFI